MLQIPISKSRVNPLGKKQRGVYLIIITVGLSMLLGFVGLAIDLARQMVVNSELKNATDACALAASLELNGLPNAPQRAFHAGKSVGEIGNKVNFQSEPVVIDNVLFSNTKDGSYIAESSTQANVDYRYVKCVAKKIGFINYFMAALGKNESTLVVTSTATQVSSRSACTIPLVAIVGDATAPYGFDVNASAPYGLWKDATSTTPYFKILNLSSNNIEALAGYGFCYSYNSGDVLPASTIPSLQRDQFVQAWNAKFGLSKSLLFSLDKARPDITGYGTPTSSLSEYINSYNLGSAPSLPYPSGYSPTSGYASYKSSGRRVIALPIAGIDNKFKSWGCFLINNPISNYYDKSIRWIGLATNPDSPCVVYGVPGGVAASGPLVPALIN